jgi:NAD-dependent dihydropyrimidine dehydrogenase PreA subunit
MEPAYRRLIQHLQTWAMGFPEAPEIEALLAARVTAQEADLLARIPFFPQPLEQLSLLLGRNPVELRRLLDPLAQRGLVFRHESKSTVRYALNDSMFDFYRSPFWAGTDDEGTRRLAGLSNRYFFGPYGPEFGAYPTMGLRAIPIGRTIKDTRQVLPYEDLVQVLEGEKIFCTSHCPCRQRKNLDPESPNCKYETFNCLHFGRLARYMIKNEMGKEISREETLEILQAAAEAGLVHGISNTREGMDTICNCCSCCCLFLESVHHHHLFGHQPSNYLLEIEPSTCKACGLCVERCPMKALSLQPHPEARNRTGQAPTLEPDRCLGCGVCVFKCPSASLGLVLRSQEQDFPLNFRDQVLRMGRERGRDITLTSMAPAVKEDHHD